MKKCVHCMYEPIMYRNNPLSRVVLENYCKLYDVSEGINSMFNRRESVSMTGKRQVEKVINGSSLKLDTTGKLMPFDGYGISFPII